MGIAEKRVSELAEETGAPSPTPGGGSIAAVCGALSASLVRMVAGLALGKEEYKDSQEELREICENAERLQDRLLSIADEDSAAYDAVAAALKMPRGTPEEKAARKDTLQLALKKAAEVPLDTMEMCRDTLILSKTALEKGSRSAFTDAGSASLFALAAMRAAALNARVNLLSIKDEAFCNKMRERIASLMAGGSETAGQIEQLVEARLK